MTQCNSKQSIKGGKSEKIGLSHRKQDAQVTQELPSTGKLKHQQTKNLAKHLVQ